MRPIDIATAAAIVACGIWFVWMVSRGNDERAREDEARGFFDEHGVWPDELPDDDARRAS